MKMTEMAVNNAATCRSWPTLLAWIENDLPEEEAELLNTHVADCEVCRAKLAVMNAVQGWGELTQAKEFAFNARCSEPP